ncbi:unnamed protein product [Protopolystoma xenopodis]|uniref:Uncharacterized protein n=1 Tax=Protopolystoma xenopodis TaxID=117903 RepID=A0A448WA54_9PLAT|nr:unnamed protein product [Protopolystoma xenopodis]
MDALRKKSPLLFVTSPKPNCTGLYPSDIGSSAQAPGGGTSPSQWSAIVGLVTAMLLLVMLLCSMLALLRRRFLTDERKSTQAGKCTSFLFQSVGALSRD